MITLPLEDLRNWPVALARDHPQLTHNGANVRNPAGVPPRVFLSYSHDSEAHRAWVRELAERLVLGGVEVTLDQWDLPYGADVVRFMDLGIRDADRVLMVCTANYVAKAEERKGGAGYEGMVVTGHVARATDTIKFVPIVRGNSGEPLVPGFLGQRLWLDFRNDGLFDERLDELLRELHGAPRYVKPPLGRNPFAGPAPGGAWKVLEVGTKAALRGPSPSIAEGNHASASHPSVETSPPAVGAPQPSYPAAAASPLPLALSPLTVTTARLRREADRWQVDRQEVRVKACEVALGEGKSLRMIHIPAGDFLMGSPADEIDHASEEGPQHRAQLGGFLFGQTPVTQEQWAVVAAWPKQELDLQPDPSFFKGAQRPVEQVRWEQAIEFCRRLSYRTSLFFTLPSEAQWEYACRAGSASPFAFGDTLTAELANYDARYIYGDGPKGEYRRQTMPVGLYPANAWGLQDLHGNVWEWCLDHWHVSYKGAPTDGSPLLSGDDKLRVLRGGSWLDSPKYLRSACRYRIHPVFANYLVGLRVVCLPHGPSLKA